MKYLISIILLILISFTSILITMALINKDSNVKSNLKSTSVFMVVVLPIISLVGGTLFLIFKLIAIIMKLQATTFEIFIMSIIGALSIFIGDFLTKKIMLGVSTKYFSNKYKNTTLTEDEMMNILEKKQKVFNMYSLLIMFGINIIIYLATMVTMAVAYNYIFLIIISIISLITYKILFRSNSVKDN